MKILLLAFFCYYYLTIICCVASSPNQCGHQNGGKICPEGLCCSHDGYCGNGDAYCIDCQNNCPNHTNPIPECGRQNGGKFCPDGECCSEYGFCGHTYSYCVEGCQSNCVVPGECPVDDHLCGVQNGGRICPEGFCCSKSGFCGTGETFCGSGCQNNCPNMTNPEPECGNNLTCPDHKCCSEYGFCGETVSYCSIDCFCQSNCWPPPPTPPSPPPAPTPSPSPPAPGPGGDGVSSIISKELFEEMLSRRNDDPNCAIGFYNYEAFIEAADFFEGFGTTGDLDTRKRELAAFFGQTSHETTGGVPSDYTWGYCFKKEVHPTWDYCENRTEWPCAPGKQYYGRGPIQISYNYNYGPCGKAINYDLLNDPGKAENDVVISFKTAIWFWMTPQAPKPSCHDVMIGKWTPSECDKSAGRVPGYGVITNIINGGAECGMGPNMYGENRIGFYKRYCDMLGVSYGDNLDCSDQKNFNLCSETKINGGVAVI